MAETANPQDWQAVPKSVTDQADLNFIFQRMRPLQVFEIFLLRFVTLRRSEVACLGADISHASKKMAANLALLNNRMV